MNAGSACMWLQQRLCQASDVTSSPAFRAKQTPSISWGNSFLKITFPEVQCCSLTPSDPRRRPPLSSHFGQALQHIQESFSADSVISDGSQMFTWHQWQEPDAFKGRLCSS